MEKLESHTEEYSRFTCPTTGLSILSKPEWVVDLPQSKYRAVTTILGQQILKTEVFGYSSRTESRKTAEVLDSIIPRYLDTKKGIIQIFDLKESSGFSLASRRNYIRCIKKRSGILGQIFYNTSLMFNFSVRIGRKLYPGVNFGFHIVNTYEEAVELASKLITAKLPASSSFQVDTAFSPPSTFPVTEYCPVTGLPVLTRPEWTRVDLGNNYEATFKVIGNSILLSDPRGRADYDAFERFFDLRDKIIAEVFGKDKFFIEIKDFFSTRTPSKSQRRLFVDRMARHDNQIIGFIAYNAPLGVRFTLNVGKRLIFTKQPSMVADNYEKAILMATSALNFHGNTGELPARNFFSPEQIPHRTRISYSDQQIERYVDEMLHCLAGINWEIDGLDSTMEKIPPTHPFSLVYEAIAIVKSDLDHLTKERRKALKALLKSEKLYRLLAENAKDVIWTSDVDRNPIYYSPSAFQMTGYDMDELMVSPIETHMTLESRAFFLSTIRHALDGAPKEGVDSDAFNLLELEHIHKSGNRYWTEVKVSLIHDSDGRQVGLMGVTRDISERKQAEAKAIESLQALQQTQEQLIQAEKMASLGSLVAGVSHEISTPLGISVTASSFLHQKTTEFENKIQSGRLTQKDIVTFINLAQESTSMISNNLGRASELINSFKQVSVDQSNEMKRRFNLLDYTRGILRNLNPNFKRTSHTIDLNCPEEIHVVSYPGALSQILTNLVINSFVHGFEKRENGVITIRMWDSPDNWFIEYKDNGAGMNKETLKKVYDPFYTTRRASGGTGLGMHIVYNIVTAKLKGQIRCESKPEEGTTFLIQLPH